MVFGFVGTINATGASLYISPISIIKTAGEIFSASVGFNASGNKVCAVEGTLVFNNLSCQSITVSNDVMAQSSPTCSNPHFLIGIPNCTTSDRVLLTVSVRAGSAGIASISATSVDVIGEGASVGSASINGNYIINAVPKPTSTPTPTPNSTQQAIQSTQQTTQQITQTTQQTTPDNSLPANIGVASLAIVGSKFANYLWMALIILIIIGIGYGIYYFIKKK